MYKVEVTPNAQMQIEQITKYMLTILLSSQAANNFAQSIKEKYINLSKNPHLYPKDYFGCRKYHKAIVGQYIMAFRIDEQTRTVHIMAIGHSRQKRKNIIKH